MYMYIVYIFLYIFSVSCVPHIYMYLYNAGTMCNIHVVLHASYTTLVHVHVTAQREGFVQGLVERMSLSTAELQVLGSALQEAEAMPMC